MLELATKIIIANTFNFNLLVIEFRLNLDLERKINLDQSVRLLVVLDHCSVCSVSHVDWRPSLVTSGDHQFLKGRLQ